MTPPWILEDEVFYFEDGFSSTYTEYKKSKYIQIIQNQLSQEPKSKN